MPKAPLGGVWRHAHTLFNEGVIGDVADEQLLERFVTAHREAGEMAFEALVERHGPMVLRICREILRDSVTNTTPRTLSRRHSWSWRARPLRSEAEPPWPVGSTGSPAVSPPVLDRPRPGAGSMNGKRPVWPSTSWPSRDGMTLRRYSMRRSIGSRSDIAHPSCSVTWRA